jgi:putative chitinase
MDISKLKGQVPDGIFAQLPDTIAKFRINTPLRLAHFISQCAHESANFTHFQENLNYSEQGLLTTFPKYFNATTAAQFARQPEKIANHIYANRLGNGNEASGDGWKHRGMGALQITGKANQEELFTYLGLSKDTDPSLIATKYQLASAAYFFMKNNLFAICEQGATPAVVSLLTKRINGGQIGLAERQHLFDKFYPLLKTAV